MESLMVCFNQDCIEKKQQFYHYPSQRQDHQFHHACHIHPTSFIRMFNQQLFSQQEIHQFQNELQASFRSLHTDIFALLESMILSAAEWHKTTCQDMLNVFHKLNEVEFAKKLEEAANGGNIEYLYIANAVMTNQATDIKMEVKRLLQNRFQLLRKKALLTLQVAIKNFNEEFEINNEIVLHHERQEQNLPQYEYEEKEVIEMEVQQVMHFSKQSDNRMDQLSTQQINSSSMEPHFDSSSPVVEEKTADQHSEQIYLCGLKSSNSPPPPPPIINEAFPKEKAIKKRGRRGRPMKQNYPANVQIPIYDSIFKQSDMDYFFPKTEPRTFIVSISQFSTSPLLTKKPSRSICIQDGKDYELIKKHPILSESACELTVCQKNISVPDVNFKLNLIFNLFNRPNQLQYFHLKDVFLDMYGNMGYVRDFLKSNKDSMQTLMIEQCWKITEDVTIVISQMHNLKKLKLHSSYNRNFPLCIDHFFHLEGLTCLSLSNCHFFDNEGYQIEEENTSVLENISQLKNLVYLTLYHCYPIFSDFLDYLHPDLHEKLRHLNLAITDINQKAIAGLSKFTNLQELSVDQTQIKGKDLIQIFEKNPQNNLKELSLWQLNNSRWSQEKRGFQNGYITKQEMSRMAQLLPNLIYLNIAHCKSLKGFNLLKFQNLQYVCVSNDLYTQKELSRFRKKMIVYVERLNQEAEKKAINVDEDENYNFASKQEDPDYEPDEFL